MVSNRYMNLEGRRGSSRGERHSRERNGSLSTEDTGRSGRGRQRLKAIVEVADDSLFQTSVDSVNFVDVSGDFGGTFGESCFVLGKDARISGSLESHLLPLEVLQMLDSHLEDVCLLQFGVSGGIPIESIQDERLEFIEAVIDARSTSLFHDWFGGSSVFRGRFVGWFLGDFNVEASHG